MAKRKNTPTNRAGDALKRAHAAQLRAEMQQGVVRRAVTFPDRRKDASRKACRGKGWAA